MIDKLNKLKDKINKDRILDQTILLNWIRANTNIYDNNKEQSFESRLKDFIINIIDDEICLEEYRQK